ncbi:MAG: tRNA lysidine(34) synthetase TilS [Rubrivivax sp.]
MVGSATPLNADPGADPSAAPGGDERVAVAVSGGLDSTALLHCVMRAARGQSVTVHALHVHHGLQPQADDWVRHLAAQCRRWRVPLHVQRLERRPPAGESVEAWARRERYAALAQLADAVGCRAVLLAHHRRDQAETVLLQLQRGGGARALAGVPAAAEHAGIRWLRPWLALPREAVRAYATRYRLRWIEDPSNDDERFARNRLRRQSVALLADHEAAIALAARRAQEEAACLHALAGIDAAASTEGDALRVMAWGLLDEPRRANLLRHWFRAACGRGLPQTLLERLLKEMPVAAQARWPAPDGELRLHGGWLRFDRQPAAISFADDDAVLDLSQPGRYALVGGHGVIEVEEVKSGGVTARRLAQVRLRARQGGERFQAAPGRPPRALKKQYQMLGVAAWDRVGPLVVALDGQLLFVPGLGIDARVLAPAGQPQLTLRWTADAGA